MTPPRSTFSLIGERYLDTQLEPDEIELIDRELTNRGVVGFRRWRLEVVAAGALWWNVIWWEWVDLDERDVRIGWFYNLVLGGTLCAGSAYCFGAAWAAAAAAAFLAFALWMGFSLRAGTVARGSEA